MKIELFTYFSADNYGATLQTYSTIKILEKLGHCVELANYKIPEPKHSILKKILLYPKHLRFNRFRNKYFLNISENFCSYKDLYERPPLADCYLTGSDQTWNPEISKNMAPGFFLNFGDDNILRGSYSASIGMDQWEDTIWINKNDVKKALSRFDFLSIREKSGVEILKNDFQKDAVLVIDPVLLFQSYPELTGECVEEPIIVTYKLSNSKAFYDKVRNIAARNGLKCRSIGSLRRISGYLCAYPESIELWIKRLGTARYVFTDSFHGTVISIIYHRQFVYSVGNAKRNTRIVSLLSLLGLEDRITNDHSTEEEIQCIMNRPIDWEMVDKKLDSFRESSINFLERSLSNR